MKNPTNFSPDASKLPAKTKDGEKPWFCDEIGTGRVRNQGRQHTPAQKTVSTGNGLP
jgi:hypothetical protein